MNPHENYQTQRDELDLLQNIIFDKLTIHSESPTFSLEITTQGNVDDPKMEFSLNIDLPEDYPNISPSFTLTEDNNFLPSSKVKEIEAKLLSICTEYTGMPVIYQLYEEIQSFADAEEQKMIDEQNAEDQRIANELKLIEDKKREEELKLLESKTYTPVTKELFDEWYKSFVNKEHKKKTAQSAFDNTKLTGRQFFMNRNIKLDDDVNEDEIEQEKVDNDKTKEDEQQQQQQSEINNFNPELYEDDIDDIDFDNDDNIDDI